MDVIVCVCVCVCMCVSVCVCVGGGGAHSIHQIQQYFSLKAEGNPPCNTHA